MVSSEVSTESVVNESSEINLLAIEESQSTPADVLVPELFQVEAEQVSQVSQVEEISEQLSQESANLEAVSQQEQNQEVSESQSNENSEVSQSESSQAVNEVGLVSAQNIPDIIASIENEVKVLQVIILNQKKLNQLHAVSRTQQGRQREPSIKTLRSPLSAEYWRHCVLSRRTQRRA